MSPEVEAAVTAAISAVLRDTGRGLRPIKPGMLLAADLGLDSLDLAQTIVLLERTLGCDPFRSASSTTPALRTVADLITIYSRSLGQP